MLKQVIIEMEKEIRGIGHFFSVDVYISLWQIPSSARSLQWLLQGDWKPSEPIRDSLFGAMMKINRQ